MTNAILACSLARNTASGLPDALSLISLDGVDFEHLAFIALNSSPPRRSLLQNAILTIAQAEDSMTAKNFPFRC